THVGSGERLRHPPHQLVEGPLHAPILTLSYDTVNVASRASLVNDLGRTHAADGVQASKIVDLSGRCGDSSSATRTGVGAPRRSGWPAGSRPRPRARR